MRTCPPALTFLTLLLLFFFAITFGMTAAEMWVSPAGSDSNDASPNAPLRSLHTAVEKLNHGEKSPPKEASRIFLSDGIYPLTTPISYSETDFSLSVEAAPGAHPILSGAIAITNWTKATEDIPGIPGMASGKIWTANIPIINGHPLEFRQLWINDRKAVRARNPNSGVLFRLVAWDKTNHVATISATALSGVNNPANLEMVIDQVWEIAVLRIKQIEIKGTNAFLTFKEPESTIEFQHPWPPVIVNAKYHAPFYLANAIQFLDQPGEWFEDTAAGKIYYWPRENEDMTHATAFAPATETLLQIQGTLDHPAHSIHFKGITFAYTTWLRPSQQGHVPLQAGMYLLDAKKLSPKGTPYHPGLDNLAWIGRPPAAVSVKNATDISFENCTFEHLASAGLDFESGTHNDSVQGCIFQDIGGNGLHLGKFSDTNIETHVPYNPSDEREVCHHESISNNLVTDCGAEDWGCVGIAVGYARNISIVHNEIAYLPYTGISVGWGWTKMTNALRNNLIFANRIHHVGQMLGDLGGIYTLSAQPGTVIAENSIFDITPSPYVPDPEHWFYLYLDEGSSQITVRDNWCPSNKFLKNANGPGNLWTNNVPQVSPTIKTNAGLNTLGR